MTEDWGRTKAELMEMLGMIEANIQELGAQPIFIDISYNPELLQEYKRQILAEIERMAAERG